MTTTNAQNTFFGLELELQCPQTLLTTHDMQIGPYHAGIQVPFLPNGWRAERDSSITVTHANHVAVEIVSPKLKGAEGIHEVITVLQKLRDLGFKISPTGGIHISVNFDRNAPAERLARLLGMVSYLEKALFASTGTTKRENCSYCKGIRKYGDQPKAKAALDPNRYHILNITNLSRGQDRVEYRCFSGSLNATKIAGWIQMCLGITLRAIDGKRTPAWEPKPSRGGWARKNEGEAELNRAIGFLGWTDGAARLKGGVKYGIISDEIPVNEIIKEFRRLARKYDSEQ
ncbi:MAG: amidoligase family protein [Thermoguttaceae bacterium]